MILSSVQRLLNLNAAGFRRFSTTSGKPQSLAFIGLGNMGFPMVQNLIRKTDFNISVFDTNPNTQQLATREGALVASSPAEAAKDAEYIVTMLPGNDQVKSVYEGIFSELKGESSSNRICIDCSTVDPAVSSFVDGLCQDNGYQFADAPVSGGTGGAKGGTLTFMVGGASSVFENIKPNVLSHMGTNIVHCGEKAGSGEVAKLCNNLILGVSMAAVSEAMNLGTKLGVDPKVLSGIINTSSGRCWSSDTYNPYPGVMENVPSSNDYQGGFASDLMLKDLRLAVEAAKNAEASTPIGEFAKSLYEKVGESGFGGNDFSVVLKYLAQVSK